MSFKNYGKNRKALRQTFRGRLPGAQNTGQFSHPTSLPNFAAAAHAAMGKTGGGTTYPAAKKFKPVSDEVTIYGAKKFRTPYSANQFVGEQGSPIIAGVLDIDGTMSGFGSGMIKSTMEWIEKVEKEYPEIVWLVITARDHGSFGYVSSFNWVMHHFPRPFIGPFARPVDDPRYASEFKRELVQGFEDMGLYRIVAAADDNEYVIDMWEQWGKDHFEEPKDFMLLKCLKNDDYGYYRGGLPDKTTGKTVTKWSSPTTYGSTTPAGGKAGEVWITGFFDNEAGAKKADGTYAGRWQNGFWAKKGTKDDLDQQARDKAKAAKNRPAGQQTQSNYGTDPKDGKWKARTEFADSADNPILTDLDDDPNWQRYIDMREENGAYLGAPPPMEVEAMEDDEDVLIGMMTRPEMEEWVSHEHKELTPDDIANMTPQELWKAVSLDYREDLVKALEEKWGRLFHLSEFDLLSDDELAQMYRITNQEEAEDFIDAIIRDIGYSLKGRLPIRDVELPEPAEEEASEDPSEDRQFLESEVYAKCPDRQIDEIADASDEQLTTWLRTEGTDTGQLNPAEVLQAATAEGDDLQQIIRDLVSEKEAQDAAVEAPQAHQVL